MGSLDARLPFRPPGSGKSTLAYPLTSHINALLLGRAPEPSSTDLDTGLTSRPGDSDTPEQPGDEDVAICVGLDGWHYSRKELDGFDDPIEAHWRRVCLTLGTPFSIQVRLAVVASTPMVSGSRG